MRKIVHLNDAWHVATHEVNHLKEVNTDTWSVVDLPHTAEMLPFHNFDEKIYQQAYTYVKKVKIDGAHSKQKAILTFEGVAHVASVYFNQIHMGTHYGGYTRFSYDVTSEIRFDEDNEIMVVVDGSEDNDVPPFGGLMDYLGYCGIYREVYLTYIDELHIKDVFVEQHGNKDLKIHIKTSTHLGELVFDITDPKGQVVEHQSHSLKMSQSTFYVQIENPLLWDLDTPNLYQITVKISDKTNEDTVTHRFGIRSAVFKKDGFYLNDKKIKLMGLNRHQSFPYVGYAMPKSAQEEDAEILKYTLGTNIVRTSHYPQSIHFLNRCDEIGLLVFEEIPGWQHIGNDLWKARSLENTESMIVRDRNHPSIVLWGVRINESPDDHDFYEKTNALARSLDPSRQTGGVRNLTQSEFMEDVYTYNDFSHTGDNLGLLPKKKVTKDVPYLVTEYNGHMYPTKRFDDETHRLSHLKRHLNVIDAMMVSNNGIAGAIGWCMNDYNTHQEFGSGDRVCYHGVLDMFRIPKIAAYAYQSQGVQYPMLEVTSSMNIGEHAAGNLPEIYVMTNLDYVKVYKNEDYLGTYQPDHHAYPNLTHPPIVLSDLIGELLESKEGMTKKDATKVKKIFKAITTEGNRLRLSYKIQMLFLLKKYHWSMADGVNLFYKYVGGWGTEGVSYRFEGYQGDKMVKVVTKENDHDFDLDLSYDDKPLVHGPTYDVKRYVIRKLNQHQELITYASDDLTIKVTGAIARIGPAQIHLVGGAIGFWIRTLKKGSGEIIIESSDHTLIEEVEVL